jgi:hypothetical protein
MTDDNVKVPEIITPTMDEEYINGIMAYLRRRDMRIISLQDYANLYRGIGAVTNTVHSLNDSMKRVQPKEEMGRILSQPSLYDIEICKRTESLFLNEDRTSLKGSLNFCVTKIEVCDGPSEFRLCVNGTESTTKSQNGVLRVSDIEGSPEFMKFFDVRSCMDEFLSKDSRDHSLSCSRFDTLQLMFDTPFPLEVKDKVCVHTEHYQVFRNDPFLERHPYFCS